MAFLDLFCFLSHSACVCRVGWLVLLAPQCCQEPLARCGPPLDHLPLCHNPASPSLSLWGCSLNASIILHPYSAALHLPVIPAEGLPQPTLQPGVYRMPQGSHFLAALLG